MITPLDIRKQPFPRAAFRGFDPDAVNSFLGQVADEYEVFLRQHNELATQVKSLEQQLEKYTKIERVLNETLMTAQEMSDTARVNAQKEAELIIKEAQIRAERYMADAQRKVDTLVSESSSIRNQRDSFLARFKSMLSTQLSLLEVISGDLRQDDEQKDEIAPPPPVRHATQTQRAVVADDDMVDVDVPPQPVIV